MAGYVEQRYGLGLTLSPAPPPGPIGSGVHNGAVTGSRMSGLDPDNPMLWLLGIAAVTLGLIGATTSVRFGPFRASASAGSS